MTELFRHQEIAVERLTSRSHFGLFMEMGTGKTLSVIEAARRLHQAGIIDHVIVICPASVRAVWFDPMLGELAKHLKYPIEVIELHRKPRRWATASGPRLRWTISNYDYLRGHLDEFRAIANGKTLLVCDESSALKSWKTKQTKAATALRQRCGRAVILNGTPISNNPGDLFSQMRILDPGILGIQSEFQFKLRYGVMGGFEGRQVVAWRNLDDLQARIAPHVMRVEKKDCLDLPDKLPPVTLEVPLSPKTWAHYREMRQEMIVWLGEQRMSAAPQAAVRAMRLSQLTSGFLGGIVERALCGCGPIGDCMRCGGTGEYLQERGAERVSTEKLDLLAGWLEDRLAEDPAFKVLVWSRFRAEVDAIAGILPKPFSCGRIWGAQQREEREHALRLLDPRTCPPGAVAVIGTPASGSMGLNLAAANTVVYVSNDYSFKTRIQSEDRVHRPGQVKHVSYFDVVATGPDGQRTIDHAVIQALRAKESLANFTISAWRAALDE